MSHRSVAALAQTLRGHVGLGNSRLETLCMLVVGMIGARTVNLGHIASGAGRGVQIASTYRRLQRFFQHVELDPDWAAMIVARLIGPAGAWTLGLDRTTWKIGTRDVNYLVLAVITRRFRVPLFWTLLDGPGNSGTETRIALMTRYLAHFPASTVRLLLADREFIGAEWLKFLNDNNIPFAIRLREDLRVTTEDGCELTLFARLRLARRTQFFQARPGAREHVEARGAPLLHFAAKRLGTEWLIVVSNVPSRQALAAYRKRWAIECMFGDAKTRGLNLEDTRLTDPRKLALLMALVALAIVWAGRAAADLLGQGSPRRKSHGHFAQSWFRIGFDRVRNLLSTDHSEATAAWRRLKKQDTRTSQISGVV
jgi:Transposase DDE domain